MANLTVVVRFTIDKAPATGLTLADIDLYLAAINKTNGAETVIWDGTQNPSAELSGQGAYLRVYSSANFETHDYLARAVYTGATVLDSNYSYGAASGDALSELALADLDTLTGRLTAQRAANLDNLDAAISTRASSASITALNNLSAQQVWEYATRTLTASLDPTAAQIWASATRTLTASLDPSAATIVSTLLTALLDGRAFEEVIKDIWAQVAGDFEADDGDDPTEIVYDGPDGSPQLTHQLTDTTRTRV